MARLGRNLPSVICADFYDTAMPPADAVIGNPPYLRRHDQEKATNFRAGLERRYIGEFLIRSHSFQYGGGVFNLNAGPVQGIPVIDPQRPPLADRARLTEAWALFVAGYENAPREELDREVAEVLGISPAIRQGVEDACQLLVRLARASNKVYLQN